MVDKSKKFAGSFLFTLLLYISGLVLWLAGRALTGDTMIYVIGLNYLEPWLFSPLLVFIPWAVFSRNKTTSILIIIPISVFLWFFCSAFLPKTGEVDNPNTPLRVVSFNLHIENLPDEDSLANLDSFSSNILAFQEVSWPSEKILTQRLSDQYPIYQYNGRKGLAIYSIYPIQGDDLPLDQEGAFQSVILQVGNKRIHFINAHLAQTGLLEFISTGDMNIIRDAAASRSAEVNGILREVERVNLPTIMACDCNMTILTSTYPQLTENLQDAYRLKGWGLGHTLLIPRGFEIQSQTNLPFQRIDYVFTSSQMSVTQAALSFKEMGSDHRPLLVQLDLGP